MVSIILTIIAWKRGWGRLALIPLFIVLIGGFMIGFGAAVNNIRLPLAGLLLFEMVIWGILIGMIACPPRKAKTVPAKIEESYNKAA